VIIGLTVVNRLLTMAQPTNRLRARILRAEIMLSFQNSGVVCNNKTTYHSPIELELIVNSVLLENDHLKYCFSFSDLLVCEISGKRKI